MSDEAPKTVSTIAREAVQSSCLSSIGYDHDRRILAVAFPSGLILEYDGVSQALAWAFAGAPSKGTFFHRAVRGKFHGRAVVDPPPMGECPDCGDLGTIGCRCEDCGCSDYRDRTAG